MPNHANLMAELASLDHPSDIPFGGSETWGGGGKTSV